MIPKFRAYVKTRKRMVFSDDILAIDYENKEIVTQQVCSESGLAVERDIYCNDFDEIELMQSTGFKDKNGKEIFEGDIIRTNAYGCIVGFGEYTYFEDDGAQTTEIGFYLSFLNVKPATYAPFDNYYWENCEVIGNIYENELDLIMYEAYKYNKETSEATEEITE